MPAIEIVETQTDFRSPRANQWIDRLNGFTRDWIYSDGCAACVIRVKAEPRAGVGFGTVTDGVYQATLGTYDSVRVGSRVCRGV